MPAGSVSERRVRKRRRTGREVREAKKPKGEGGRYLYYPAPLFLVYAYDADGNLSIFDGSGNVRTSTAEGNRYNYTGREWEPDLGLYHYRARETCAY